MLRVLDYEQLNLFDNVPADRDSTMEYGYTKPKCGSIRTNLDLVYPVLYWY